MEDKTLEYVPQVGSGLTEESHSSMEDCPADSGGDNRPLIEATARLVGNQATQAANVTGREGILSGEDSSPFRRRDSITRSPPALRRFVSEAGRQRSGSCSSVVLSTESNASKRKRQEVPGKALNSKEIQEVLDSVKKLNEDASALNKEVENSYKPKREIKSITKDIMLWTKELETKMEEILVQGAKEWPGVTREIKESETQKVLRAENRYLHEQIKEIQTKHKRELEDFAYSTNEERCEECKKIQRKEARRRILTKEYSYENFQKITDEDWKEGVFPKVRTRQGLIWEAPTECGIILPCNKNIDTSCKIIGKTIDKFGGKEGLRKQNKQKGEVAMMTYTLGFPDEEGNYVHTSRDIYCPILSDGETDVVDDQIVFQSLNTIREYVTKYQKGKLAIPEIEGHTGLVIARMIEFLFSETKVEITMYKDRDGLNTLGGSTKGTKIIKPKLDALLIRTNGKSYADLLKTIRTSVDPSQIGVDVKGIKKTRSGELLLTVQNGPDKAEALKKEIQKKIPEAATSLLINKRILHVKDLDEAVTVEEIKEAVTKQGSISPERVDVRALRPAYANKQNVTLVLTEVDAKKLIELGKIKIGWTKCRIVERKNEMKCFRCWQYGHVKTQCTGPDREKLCMKCTQEGHKAIECKNKPYCVHCKKGGHQSGNPKCPQNNKRRVAGSVTLQSK